MWQYINQQMYWIKLVHDKYPTPACFHTGGPPSGNLRVVHRFKMIDDPTCLYKMSPRTTDHLLWECELLKKQRQVLRNISKEDVPTWCKQYYYDFILINGLYMFRTFTCPFSGVLIYRLFHCRMWCYGLGVEAVVLRSWCVVLCTVCQLVSNWPVGY